MVPYLVTGRPLIGKFRSVHLRERPFSQPNSPHQLWSHYKCNDIRVTHARVTHQVRRPFSRRPGSRAVGVARSRVGTPVPPNAGRRDGVHLRAEFAGAVTHVAQPTRTFRRDGAVDSGRRMLAETPISTSLRPNLSAPRSKSLLLLALLALFFVLTFPPLAGHLT